MSEKFRPLTHDSPTGIINTLKYYIRLTLDLQFCSVRLHLKPILKTFTGNVLDIGAGNGPFRHLLNDKVVYTGLDIKDSETFDYENKSIVHYDGNKMPFEDNSFNHFICTEVLEHIAEPELFISEAFRVLKPGGTGVFTIPWSARFHYQPFDYHRYTPSMLKILFNKFASVEILPRGTDVAAIISKIIVLYFRCLFDVFAKKFNILFFLFNIIVSIVVAPLLILAIPFGLLGTYGIIGSDDDPLGYTIILKK